LAFERGSLRIAHPGFHFAFAIRIVNATGQRHSAVTGRHVTITRVERGFVNVWREHAFAQIVEAYRRTLIPAAFR